MSEIIEEQRQVIDEIDKSIMDLLVQRFAAAKAIGIQKQELGSPVLDTSREEAALNARVEYAEQVGLNPEFVCELTKLVMNQAKVIQTDIPRE